ncbi:MAG: glycosyltransferase family 4 protein [Methylobacteriaceae bacterium]|nr:glycosyltransferase family 4 protein [Methylobacteriaceae bacterium]
MLAMQQYAPAAIGLNLALPADHQRRRYLWNLKQVLQLRGAGGYQYSHKFSEHIWRQDPRIEDIDATINMFQHYGDEFFYKTSARRVFYIDQTLDQLFNFYVDNARISASQQRAAIEREARQYRDCEKIICKSEWAKASLTGTYGIAPEKIAILKPGGNIEPRAYREFEMRRLGEMQSDRPASDAGAPLRFVFVGKEPARKGLYRFIDALRFVERAAERVRLTVIGPEVATVPAKYKALEGIEWIGPIDKGRDTARFIDLVSANDIGILLSTIDAGGLSLREFQMLGLGVIAPKVGGSWEMAVEGAGLFVDPTDTPVMIGDLIERLLADRGLVSRLKQTAWDARNTLTLDHAASELLRLAYAA